jgi:hypothetical protein
MTTPENLSAEYVKRILKTLDPDLATIVVCSGVSLDPAKLVKVLIAATDVSYYRNMKRDMEKAGNGGGNELSAAEIATLLEADGWIL